MNIRSGIQLTLLVTLHAWVPAAMAQDPYFASSTEITAEMKIIEESIRKMSIGEAVEERQIRELICAGLLTEDEFERRNFVSFLSDNQRWIDSSLFEECFGESTSKFGGDYSHLLDKTQFRNAARGTKQEIIAKCIENGEYRLWRGTRLNRGLCIGIVSLEGMENLIPLAKGNYEKLTEKEKSILPWGTVNANLELRIGCLDSNDADSVALERLSAMSPQSLYSRMETDPGFEQAVVSLTRVVCEKGWDVRCEEAARVFISLEQIYYGQASPDLDGGTTSARPTWMGHVAKNLLSRQKYELSLN